MQWVRKRRLLWVIGSANHSLLISHYHLSLSDEEVSEDSATKSQTENATDCSNIMPGGKADTDQHEQYTDETFTSRYSRNFHGHRTGNAGYLRGFQRHYNSKGYNPHHPHPRVCYPSYPSTSYRPLQSLEWFDPQIPSNYQCYYMLSSHRTLQREQSSQLLPLSQLQQPYAYSWNALPSLVYYPPAYVDDKGQEHASSYPYIYPGYAFQPTLHHHSLSSKKEPNIASGSSKTATCSSHTDTSQNQQVSQNTESKKELNLKSKKKRKRKRKRKSVTSGSAQIQDDNKEVHDNDDEEEADDEQSGSCSGFSECLTENSLHIHSDDQSINSNDDGRLKRNSISSGPTVINMSLENDDSKESEINDDLGAGSSLQAATSGALSYDSKCSTVNHIPKTSYQILFADENSFSNAPDNPTDYVTSNDLLNSSDLSHMVCPGPMQFTTKEKEVPQRVLETEINDCTLAPMHIASATPPTDINEDSSTPSCKLPFLKREPQPRDFQPLPLADHLFTANFIDAVINGAMEEIKQRQQASPVEESKDQSSDFLNIFDEVTRGVDTLTDNLHRQSDVSVSDLSSLGLEDVALDDESSSSSDQGSKLDFTLTDAVHSSVGNDHVDGANDGMRDESVSVENDWSQCNGYLAHEEETAYPGPGEERELMTEIVFISETSFMDEETQQHYDPEEVFGRSLNPDAPVFVPFVVQQTDAEQLEVANATEEKVTEDNKNEDNANCYSDFEDRVDVSDSSDDISKLPKQSLLEITDGISIKDTDDKSITKTVSKTDDESLLISPHHLASRSLLDSDGVENDTELVSLLETPNLITFGGDLFEDIDLDANENNKSSFLDDVFASELQQLTSQIGKSRSVKRSVDTVCTDDANFSDEEYIGEKYMDHQQIYDPLKYKDYYQICSTFDVPDSPLDVNHQDKTLKPLSSSTPIVPNIMLTESATVMPQQLGPKPKSKLEENDEEYIPSALMARAAEIVLHETDDISDCGSEDVETIGHRYETTDQPKDVLVNQLSLAAEMLRTKQELPYDDQFKPVMGADGTVSTIATLNHGTVLGTPSHNNRRRDNHHYYGNPCFVMDDLQPVRAKEVADSGVQSEESTDESDDFRRQWNEAQTGDHSPHKASFAYKKLGTKSKSSAVSAMLKGKSDPLCLCCEIM